MARSSFGNEVLGSSAVMMPPGDNKAVCRFQNTAGHSVSVDKAWAHWGLPASGSIHTKVVIYSDAAGVPANLLAVSAELTGHGADWVEFTFSPALVVGPGVYVWVGVHSDAGQTGGHCLATGQIYYNDDAYADGPSTSFGLGSASIANYTYPLFVGGEDGQLLLGRSSIDGGSGTYQADREHGDKFTLGGADSVQVQSISTYIQTTSATAKSKAAIFNDGAGVPTTKVAQTVEVTGATADAWLTLPFASPVTLAPGTYWLVFITSEDLNTPTIPAGGYLHVDGTDTEAGAFSSPSTLTFDYAPRGIDIYATYTVGPPPDTPSGHGWKPRPWQHGSLRGQSFKRPS